MANVYLRFGADAEKKSRDGGPRSAKARLFTVNNENIWLPISQIDYTDEGDSVSIRVPDWLVKQNPILNDHIDPTWVEAGCPD